MYNCRICAARIEPFMSFGRMPIANNFVSPEDYADEYFYELKPAHCGKCGAFQIVEIPEPSQMFHDHYAYFASTSAFMTDHFGGMAEKAISTYLTGDDPFVVEIGSNDGITLQNFARVGIRHLGIDPSTNVVEAAREKGVQTLSRFFSTDVAEQVVSEHGQADLFIATNTMHDIEDTHSVAAGVRTLLKPKGVMISEDPYLGDMIEITSYDQIYAEHMYIWSIFSLNNVFGSHGLEIFHIEPNSCHGGCMRYYLAHKGAYEQSSDLLRQMAKEGDELELDRQETYVRFRRNCETSRQRLIGLLDDIKGKGKRVVGYGATAKSCTVINYCGITSDHIEFISDTTPIKQGRFSPGAHIPINSPETFTADLPDYAVLFAWNHLQEIDAKEREFRERGGKWIIPVRGVQIL